MGRQSSGKIRVHLADGDFLVHLGIEKAVSQLEYVALESVSHTGEDAIAAAIERKPDIVLMEVALQGTDGIAATTEICARVPQTKVVMLAAAGDRETMMRAYSAGATSYLTKNQLTEDLGPALRMIHRGATILAMPPGSPRLQRPPSGESTDNPALTALRSVRDRKLLKGVAAGLTNAELSRALHISEATVKAQLSGLMSRFKVGNRVQLAVFCVQAGITADGFDTPSPAPQNWDAVAG